MKRKTTSAKAKSRQVTKTSLKKTAPVSKKTRSKVRVAFYSQSVTRNTDLDLCLLIFILASTCVLAWYYFILLARLNNYAPPQALSYPQTDISKIKPTVPAARPSSSDSALTVTHDLDDHVWIWQSTTKAGQVITPQKTAAFSLTFNSDGTLNIQTDCNNGHTSYVATGDSLKLQPIASTQMFCLESQENIFTGDLAQVSSFDINDHDLTLTLTGATMKFSAQ